MLTFKETNKAVQYQIIMYFCSALQHVCGLPKILHVCLDNVAEKTRTKIRLHFLSQNTYIDLQLFSAQILQQEEFVVILQERETTVEAGKLPSCSPRKLSGGNIKEGEKRGGTNYSDCFNT